jgi:polyisoprenoid-binding protein YceI
VSGTITIDEEPERSHVEVGLKVSSLDSGNVDRHGQLLGPELK